MSGKLQLCYSTVSDLLEGAVGLLVSDELRATVLRVVRRSDRQEAVLETRCYELRTKRGEFAARERSCGPLVVDCALLARTRRFASPRLEPSYKPAKTAPAPSTPCWTATTSSSAGNAAAIKPKERRWSQHTNRKSSGAPTTKASACLATNSTATVPIGVAARSSPVVTSYQNRSSQRRVSTSFSL